MWESLLNELKQEKSIKDYLVKIFKDSKSCDGCEYYVSGCSPCMYS
jgi:hypothetical protein